ncbi:hypothetical protein [Halosegnis rubeus]|jgi:hypothetical protein|uniref:Uncharacterized protein n=1 Tax=Halosegnis rubeus TaxID=2212850 RepID=A0A5N5UA32_9EURY|nr:hypothetical protein [Halosegnis rubeus]KAB7513475.1 hypothetical protein DP108_12870 [Halosegnis rubeus]KAB7515454.1 hypothetical protein DMP03_09560 [Halosegnis rubeus]
MREVAGCDFCGEPPTGTFDVLPAKYDPDGDGKRMVLCSHCRDALASILDPLLDAKTAADVEPGREDVTTRTAEPSDTALDGDPEPTVPDAEEGEETETEAVDAETSWEESESGASDATAESTRTAVPSGYRKVVRFLDGRELPIPRADAVEMAAGAYDLAESQVEEILEEADARGRLRVADDELRRP